MRLVDTGSLCVYLLHLLRPRGASDEKDADDGPVEEEEGLALGDDNDLSEVAPSSLLLLVGAGWCSARATMIRCTNCCRKKMNWGKMTSMQSLERRRSGCRYTCLILLISHAISHICEIAQFSAPSPWQDLVARIKKELNPKTRTDKLAVKRLHRKLVECFGSWHCGVELATVLLAEFLHRHNHDQAAVYRPNYHNEHHVDLWLID